MKYIQTFLMSPRSIPVKMWQKIPFNHNSLLKAVRIQEVGTKLKGWHKGGLTVCQTSTNKCFTPDNVFKCPSNIGLQKSEYHTSRFVSPNPRFQ